MSPSGFTALSLFTPVFQNGDDVAPVSFVRFDRLPDGRLDPFDRVFLLGVFEFLGQQRRQRADVFLIQPVNRRPLRQNIDRVIGIARTPAVRFL